MYLIDEEDYAAFALGHLVDYALESFLKLALVFGSCHKCSHIERIELFVFQILRHVTSDDTLGESFHDGCLTGSRLTDEDRVVLGTPRQYLQYSSDFVVTAYHWVEFAGACLLHEVLGVFVETLIVLVAALRAHLLSLP